MCSVDPGQRDVWASLVESVDGNGGKLIGAIGSISGYDSIFSIGYSARAAATGSDFRIPESPLTTGTSGTEGVTATPARDPVQDSVELSKNYPELLVSQTYAPPMEQQIAFAIRGAQQPSSMAESEDETDYLNNSNALYSGLAAEEQADSEESGDEDATTVSESEDPNGAGQLSEEEQQQVSELADRDREVRAHEQAHKSVGGSHAGAMSLEYQQGPDGQRYAVGGEVSIDISTSDDPSKTIAKMQQVRSAAMAPAQPSAQDYKVASQASQQEAQARAELNSSDSSEEDGEVSETENAEGEQQDTQSAQASNTLQDAQSNQTATRSSDQSSRSALNENTRQGVQGTQDNERPQDLNRAYESAQSTVANTTNPQTTSEASSNTESASDISSAPTPASAPTSPATPSGGGMASLRFNSQFAQRYAQMASMDQMNQQQNPQFQMAGAASGAAGAGIPYRSINIVA